MLAPWRVPRMMAAASAGAMLSVAGLMLQRMTGNPLASPEVLGIGAGVAFGLALGLILAASRRTIPAWPRYPISWNTYRRMRRVSP